MNIYQILSENPAFELKDSLKDMSADLVHQLDLFKSDPTSRIDTYVKKINLRYNDDAARVRTAMLTDKRNLENAISGKGKSFAAIKGFKPELMKKLSDGIGEYLRSVKPEKGKKSEHGALNRVGSGSSFEDNVEDAFENTVIDSSKIKPLEINGQSVHDLIRDEVWKKEFKITKSTFDYNKKHDLVVNSNKLVYKKTKRKIFDFKHPVNYLEAKQNKSFNPSSKIKSTMLFESGKVSTYPKLYNILSSYIKDAKTFNEKNYNLIRKSSSGLTKKEKEDREALKKELDRLAVPKEIGKLDEDKKKVNSMLKDISESTIVKNEILQKINEEKNIYIITGSHESYDPEKGEFTLTPRIVLVNDMDIKIGYGDGWKGFGGLHGTISEEKEEVQRSPVNSGEAIFKFNFESEVSVSYSGKAMSLAKNTSERKTYELAASVETYLGDLLREITNV